MTADRTEAAAKAAWDATRKPVPVDGKDVLDWNGEGLPTFFREQEMKRATDALAAADAHDRANSIARIRLDDELAEKIAERLHMVDCGCGGDPDPWYRGHADTVLDLLRNEAL